MTTGNETYTPTTGTPTPADMARVAVDAGIFKTRSGFFKLAVLSLLAGAYIAFGAVFSLGLAYWFVYLSK